MNCLLIGIITGSCAILSLLLMIKIDPGYYTVDVKGSAVLIVCSTLAVYFYQPDLDNGLHEAFKSLSFLTALWFLLTVSYTDQKTKEFSTFILAMGFLSQIIILLEVNCFIKSFVIHSNMIRDIIIAVAISFILSLFCYSKGDFLILCVIFLNFLIQQGYFLQRVFILMTVSFCLFTICNIKNIVKLKKERRLRLPFTAYIAIGFVATNALYR